MAFSSGLRGQAATARLGLSWGSARVQLGFRVEGSGLRV